MKLTILSIVFVFFSYLGVWCANREKRRILYIEELERLLIYMQSCIGSYRQELEDIYLSFESPTLDDAGFSRKLGEDGFCVAIQHIGIDREALRVLSEFGQTLGMLCAEDQIASIKRCMGELGKIMNRKRSEYPQKRKLYISFGMMVGALIFIIGI